MSNVIVFKKADHDNVDLTVFDLRMEQLIGIIRDNVELLKTHEGGLVSFSLCPIYFKGNDNEELWKRMFTSKRILLQELLDDITSEVFRNSILDSDFPTILTRFADFYDGSVPITVTIPLVKSVFTLVMFKREKNCDVAMDWVISEIYSNYRSFNQHAFKQALKLSK